jgi:hypothetical protein
MKKVVTHRRFIHLPLGYEVVQMVTGQEREDVHSKTTYPSVTSIGEQPLIGMHLESYESQSMVL